MDMTGETLLAATREKVWAALNDADVLREAIPGCQALEKISDSEFTATVVTKLGPIKAKFSGRVFLTEINAPERYVINGEGQGGIAGFAKGGAEVELVSISETETILRYVVKAQVGGKIAQLGARLIDSTAKKLANQFFERFSANVSGAPVAAITVEELTA